MHRFKKLLTMGLYRRLKMAKSTNSRAAEKNQRWGSLFPPGPEDSE
jgi:hypothetical protein